MSLELDCSMSTYLYDQAMLAKLTKWGIPQTATLLAPDDIQTLYEVINHKNDDGGIKLPLITLNRRGNFNITNVAKRPLTINALTIARTKDKSMVLNAIPIELEYQLDIYTRKRVQADEYARELAFNFINYPDIEVILPYEGTNYHHKSMIILEGNIEDNSGVPERIIHGQFTRYTMRLKIDDAYLFDVRIRDTIKEVDWTTIPKDDKGESMTVKAKTNTLDDL